MVALFCSTEAYAQESAGAEPEIRAVWVTSLAPGIRAPDEVTATIDAVRRANLNTLIAQIRRRGMVYFQSALEPRATTITGPDDWDPLAQILREAHDTSGGKRRLDVYAWFNVFSLSDQKHLAGATPRPIAEDHPDWYALTPDGEPTTFLDPGVPAYQEHFAALVAECLDRYEVDGVNLDYIRYPDVEAGYSPIALDRFRRLTGRSDVPTPDDPEWNAFRRFQVASMVRRTMVTVLDRRPDAMLSVCAVGYGGPPRGFQTFADMSPYRRVHQDWAGWANEGIVDIVTRMGYKREHIPEHAADFRGWADLSLDLAGSSGRPITIGIGGHFNQPDAVLVQYREAQARGLGTTLFSFQRPRDDAADSGEGGAASPLWDVLGRDIYPTPADPPRPVWREKTGTLAGFAWADDGSALDTVSVRLSGTELSTWTDGNGFFAFLNLAPGEYRIEAPGSTLDGNRAAVEARAVAWANR